MSAICTYKFSLGDKVFIDTIHINRMLETARNGNTRYTLVSTAKQHKGEIGTIIFVFRKNGSVVIQWNEDSEQLLHVEKHWIHKYYGKIQQADLKETANT
jgi:hypothetical protein